MKIGFSTYSFYSAAPKFGAKSNEKQNIHSTNPITPTNSTSESIKVPLGYEDLGHVEYNKKIRNLEKTLSSMLSEKFADTYKQVDEYIQDPLSDDISKYDEKGRLRYERNTGKILGYNASITFYKYNDKDDITQELCYSRETEDLCSYYQICKDLKCAYPQGGLLEYDYQKDFEYKYYKQGNKKQIIEISRPLNCVTIGGPCEGSFCITVTNLDQNGNEIEKIKGYTLDRKKVYPTSIDKYNPEDKTGFHCEWDPSFDNSNRYVSYDYDCNGKKSSKRGHYYY